LPNKAREAREKNRPWLFLPATAKKRKIGENFEENPAKIKIFRETHGQKAAPPWHTAGLPSRQTCASYPTTSLKNNHLVAGSLAGPWPGGRGLLSMRLISGNKTTIAL
jgi:hypothetical protein